MHSYTAPPPPPFVCVPAPDCFNVGRTAAKVRAMVRDVNNFFPRKKDLGEGPIEVVLGDVLDKVNDVFLAPCTKTQN